MPAPLLALALWCAGAQGAPFEATASYQARTIEGFTVRVSKTAREDEDALAPAVALLTLRLKQVSTHVPKSALVTLRKTLIWVEDNDPLVPCMTYHPDVEWLKEHGMNPEKVKSVEIGNLKTFVSWSYDQPMMVLHELSHAYHDAKYGFDGKLAKDAYQNAMDHHLYDEVEYYRGVKKKGYAATNPMEYFAELSEAYFGYNDFFPFTRPELEAYDPVGYAMVKKAWGIGG